MINGGKINLRVVNNSINAKRFYHFDIPPTANASHPCPKVSSKLHGVRPDRPRSAVDEHLLARLNLCHISQEGERSCRPITDAYSFFIARIGRFDDHRFCLWQAEIVGVGPHTYQDSCQRPGHPF